MDPRPMSRLARAVGAGALVCAAAAFSGCGSTAPQRGEPVHLPAGEVPFHHARDLYESHDYGEAALVLKSFLDADPAGPNSQEASYMLGTAYALSGQTAMAEVELRHFIDVYPGSKYMAEVEYRLGQCYWEDARPAPYDQEKTTYARDQFTRFLTLYPESPFVKDAQGILAQIDERLAEKAVLNARLYLRLKQPVSTVYYADRVVTLYPHSTWFAEALYLEGEGLAAQHKTEEARVMWNRLVQEQPGTEWAEKARGAISELEAPRQGP